MQSADFFRDFGDPLLMDYEDLMNTEFFSAGGGSVQIGSGDWSVGFTLPSPGPSGPTGPSLGDVKRILTDLANAAEQTLRDNLGRWQAGQIAAGDAIATGWRILDDFVRRALAYGPQGQISAAERDRRINPAMLRWDWIAYYIDPIAVAETGAPATPPAPVTVAGAGPIGAGPLGNPLAGNSMQQVLILGAVALIAWLAVRPKQ